ncbi:winged helix-turn-helix transcriptional regulator [Chryseobacterium foetidum]
MRFMNLKRELFNIALRMLSKELKHLEMNQFIKRTILDSHPVKIEYT